MLAVPRLDAEAQRVLREFADVAPLARGEQIPAWQPPGSTSASTPRCAWPNWCCRLMVTGFPRDMPTVFEEFVTVALREALELGHGGRVVGQDRAWCLDEAKRVSLRSDIVWYRHEAPAAVADAKYKAESLAGYQNADLYQMLAYCTALELGRGHLIYAKGSGEAVRHVAPSAAAGSQSPCRPMPPPARSSPAPWRHYHPPPTTSSSPQCGSRSVRRTPRPRPRSLGGGQWRSTALVLVRRPDSRRTVEHASFDVVFLSDL